MQNKQEQDEFEMDDEMMQYILQQLYGKHMIEKWDGGELEVDVDKWIQVVNQNQDLMLATFGAGCFWGTEKFFAKDFAKNNPGCVLGTSVGFMNPRPNEYENPSYEEVCEGYTGHIEVVHILFDQSKVSFEELVKFFFTFHDPTQQDRQMNDKGTQYASAIFCHNQNQVEVAEKIKKKVQDKILAGKIKKFKHHLVQTHILAATKYWPAEDYHQRYLESQPWGYCNHMYRFDWKKI